MNKSCFTGIDIGTISIKLALYDGKERKYIKLVHSGEPILVFDKLIKQNNLKDYLSNALLSGRYAQLFSQKYNIQIVQPVISLVEYVVDKKYNNLNYIVDIGSSGLSLIELKNNKFYRFETNSLCAAGTGAFLDQQMMRMALDYEKISQIPIIENPPSIASRCAVFAKSDLIHRQQQGYNIQQLWNGLVKGLAESSFSTLFRGKKIQHNVLLIGGLAKNKIFCYYFKNLLNGKELFTDDNPDFASAKSNLNYRLKNPDYIGKITKSSDSSSIIIEKKLLFDNEPGDSHLKYIDKFCNEIDIWEIEKNSNYNLFLGLDIGSTSTKLAVMSDSGELLFGLYTRTQGKPVDAFKTILKGFEKIIIDNNLKIVVKGFGTTGSGRKLIGQFAGADIVKNEITAHLKGALRQFPQTKTIFEIGGQDSKYIFIEDGWMKDANMNYVCAAGTGSFVEEQAKNLNIELSEIKELCKGVEPPVSSDRCTVFMEQDANQLLVNGFNKREVMASILYSVCKNYLNKVVHNRHIEEPILFLGATAKNRGLVEAFENILNKKIITSKFSHLMGAIGVAEILRFHPPEKSLFKGIDLYKKEVSLSEDNCNYCNNKCRITYMKIEGENEILSWGYMCGKEPEEKHIKHLVTLENIKKYEKKMIIKLYNKAFKKIIYIPKALQFYSHYPFWKHFFYLLNINLLPSPPVDSNVIEYSKTYSLADFCYPMKLAVGHTVNLIKKNMTPVFFPYHIQDTKNNFASNSYFCPLSQAVPSIIKSALKYNGIDNMPLITPVINFNIDDETNVRNIIASLKSIKDYSYKEVLEAYKNAKNKLFELRETFIEEAGKIEQENLIKDKPVIVILGRAYNILDNTLNLGIISTIAKYGYDVIPLDLLPISREDIGDEFSDIYWAYGQKIIAAAKYLLDKPNFFPVYLTNFSCGPDSFLLSIVENILEHKPLLILELDEHGGDAGYVTRLEAFFDRIENYKYGSDKIIQKDFRKKVDSSFNNKTVYIPPMHPIGSRLLSSAFRAYYIDSVPLTKEDNEIFSLGKSCVRGSECMPASSTIGSFIYQLRENKKHNNAALFMPCTSGPCRFGQYARLHDMILKKNNIDAMIISPNSNSNYGEVKGLLRLHLLKAVIISDIIFKLGCAVRPYEKKRGLTDSILNKYIGLIEKAIEFKEDIIPYLKSLKVEINKIEKINVNKPLVAIVGEIYVRNSPFSNSNLVNNIENEGGEAWVTPVMEWMHYTSVISKNGSLKNFFENYISNKIIHYYEKKYMNIFKEILYNRNEPDIDTVLNFGKKYLPIEIEGESILTIGRAIEFINHKVSLVVNVSPFGCMPGTIGTSILKSLSVKLDIPIVSVFYDGETDFSNILSTYINNSVSKSYNKL